MNASKFKNKYDMERQQILDQELHRDHKHISDFSDRRSNNNKSVFRLSTLKGDEGLGESLDPCHICFSDYLICEVLHFLQK
jgi:hypothetical protein